MEKFRPLSIPPNDKHAMGFIGFDELLRFTPIIEPQYTINFSFNTGRSNSLWHWTIYFVLKNINFIVKWREILSIEDQCWF